VKTKGKVFYDNDHKPIKMMGTIADVTEQKLYVKVMQESEEKFRLLADSMPQHIWTSDALGNLNYFNRSVYDFSGLTKEEAANGGWTQIVHPDDREENIKKWMEAIATGEDFLFEHRFRRYDGEYRWQLSRAIPQRDSKGKIQMWVGTSTDIDEIKKHEQQKDDFIKTASHEIKTPITTAKGYVQLLLKTHGAGNDVFLSESLLTIDKQILKLTKLITDLLDVTKIETGSLQLNKEVFSIADVINETAKDTNAASDSHKVVITQHANPLVYADKDRISQAVSNLFTNAIKYSPKADEIWVDINEDADNVVIAVKDKGIGIAPEDHKKIFDRFFRAAGKDEKTFPGFGIGLFIVNEILTLHKGKVWVMSEKDKGATFYFSLPIHR
jgi:PAS domain S-box-containing protein